MEATKQKDTCSCSTEPISSIEQLLAFGAGGETVCSAGPHKPPPLSTAFSGRKRTLDGRKPPDTQLIVCHDFKGGYLDDRFVCGTSEAENFSFRHWLQTDYFIYFSHHFVTIPPLPWIHAGHAHGVKVLGTLITEWKEGEAICAQFLDTPAHMDQVVEKLVELTVHYAFDGYLINIENGVGDGEKVVEFLHKLQTALKAASPTNSLFYYDSLLLDGTLCWQNELNEKNKPFFDACDGIFLNYCWDEEKLANSVRLSGERRADVFVGVDVFGRNCYGGGGLNTSMAVEKIAEFELSVAVFAPAWTFETQAKGAFFETDLDLWVRCAAHFSYKAWNGMSGQLQTDFCPGYGRKRFSFGQEEKEGPWFDLRRMSYQPLILPSSAGSFELEDGFMGGGALRLEKGGIWVPVDLSKPDDLLTLLVYKADQRPSLSLQVQEGDQVKRVEIGIEETETGDFDGNENGEKAVTVELSHLMPSLPKETDLRLSFQRNQVSVQTHNEWKFLCCLFCADERKVCGVEVRSAGKELLLGFLSLLPRNKNDNLT